MLNLAQKVYLASLARKEAAMPWEDDSATPEILAGLGTAGLIGGGVYAPTLAEKAIRNFAGKDLGSGYRLAEDSVKEKKALLKQGLSPLEVQKAVKKAQRVHKAHRGTISGRNAIYKALQKIGAKGPKSRAAIVAALAGLGGTGAAGLANLLDD